MFFLICKEIQMGSVAKSYVTWQLLPSEFLIYEENFLFFFISAHKANTDSFETFL